MRKGVGQKPDRQGGCKNKQEHDQMGKGDQRSKRGKIHRGTFGRRRPKPKRHGTAAVQAASEEIREGAPAAKTKTKVVKKQPKE